MLLVNILSHETNCEAFLMWQLVCLLLPQTPKHGQLSYDPWSIVDDRENNRMHTTNDQPFVFCSHSSNRPSVEIS
jgi:hypothetical protein